MATDIKSLEEFKEIIAANESGSKKIVVVDVWAEWCQPCKMFGPKFEKMAKDYEGKDVHFYKVEADENEDVAEELELENVPTIFVYHKGKIVDKFGAQEDKIAKQIDDLLAA